MKAISFKDVKPGDVICQKTGVFREVGALSQSSDPYIELFIKESGGIVTGRPNQIIGLVHRPWPDGETEEGMVEKIVSYAGIVFGGGHDLVSSDTSTRIRMQEWLTDLQKAINAYELGKPLT